MSRQERIKDLEEELVKAWFSREQSNRVRKASKSWIDNTGSVTRRLLY